MTKKLTAFILGLFLVAIGTAACGVSEEKGVPQGNQTSTQENTENTESDQTNTEERQLSDRDKQIGREALKLKEKGIVDQHGRPAPGVDLRDYPGLG